MAKKKKNIRSNNNDLEALQSFLGSVDRFAVGITGLMVRAATGSEEAPVIESTAESFVRQMRRLTDHVRAVAATAGAMQRRELDDFLRVQDGEALIERAVSLAEQTFSTGAVTKGFFGWLNENLMTIKKIIQEILDLFGISPSWLPAVFTIIDEIFNLLKGLIGTRFGLNAAEIGDQASREEVNFLREMAVLSQWRLARSPRRAPEEDASS